MNPPLPNRQTKRPVREGLVYHEIIADGLIHSACVIGFEPDERFGERMATLAWAAGASLINRNVPAGAAMARRLRESLEASLAETTSLGAAAEAAVAVQEVIPGLHRYYAECLHTRALDYSDAEQRSVLRRLIGEAVLAGLHSRALVPVFHARLCAAGEQITGDHLFLLTRLRCWADRDGLPFAHPVLEYLAQTYPRDCLECNLLSDGLDEALEGFADQAEPWLPEFWVEHGWRQGMLYGGFSPDLLRRCVRQQPEKHRTDNQSIAADFQRRYAGTADRKQLAAIFQEFLRELAPHGLGDPEISELNPVLLAMRAYYYAFWQAAATCLPGVFSLDQETA